MTGDLQRDHTLGVTHSHCHGSLELGVGTGRDEGQGCDVYSQVSALLTLLLGKAFFALAGQLGLRWDQGWGVLLSRTLSCLSL